MEKYHVTVFYQIRFKIFIWVYNIIYNFMVAVGEEDILYIYYIEYFRKALGWPYFSVGDKSSGHTPTRVIIDSRYLYEYIILYIISCITFRLYNSFTQSTSIHCPSWVNSTLTFRKVYVSSLSYILKVKSSSLLINTYKFSLRDWYYTVN
jgi:hypothetical protein